MFAAIVAALSTAVPDAGGSATAAWSDISDSGIKGGGGTASSTITFTSGVPREILVTHDIAIGALTVKVGSGVYQNCYSGFTFDVTTGQTVTFSYSCYWDSESATVTVTDNTLAATIDTFGCAFTYTGP